MQNSLAQACAHGPTPLSHAHDSATLANAIPPMGWAFTQQPSTHSSLLAAPPSSSFQHVHSTGPIPELAPLGVVQLEPELPVTGPPLLPPLPLVDAGPELDALLPTEPELFDPESVDGVPGEPPSSPDPPSVADGAR